jgi:hypothetical protein
MRDVTPDTPTDNIFLEIFHYLKNFAKNPMTEIGRLPEWNWTRVMFLQLILTVTSGVMSAFVVRNFSTWKLAQGIIIFPFVATTIGLILSSFFYYYFQVFEKRTVSFLKLVTLVFISNTFFYLFHIVAGYFAFGDILGMAFSGMLLIVGLTENFEMQKRRSIRLVGVLFALIFLVWAAEKLRDSRLVSSVSQSIDY